MNAAVFSQQFVNGLALGSIYAMIAVGLAMIYGVLRVLHIAHAGVYTAGAYLGLYFFNLTGSFPFAVLAAMVCAGFIGVLIERFIYRPMLPKPRIVALIASIGLFICMSDLFRIIAGPHQLAFDVPSIAGRITIAGITVSGADFLILGGTIVIFGSLWFLMQHTQLGFAIRAAAQDIETAKVMGIDVNWSVASVFFIGSAIAAFGGIMVGVLYNAVYTSMGDIVGYKGLALIVIGGFGSMTGAVAAAFILGFAETALTTYSDVPLSRDGIAMLMLVILILFRPQGLLGKE
ncbi:MAG: branched-chain amino acid ABC transporter permease [Pseudorhodoplanes sp.]|uniref:branched-chain amino acid ABC transporter permease n=1 Tax=Pseudorhodoplanes sp. TaxID=1934341 RepID=UPI003D0D561A